MNNAALKTTLKELLKVMEEAEQVNTEDKTVTSLLQEILNEVKLFNTERESIKKELQSLKETNDLLLQTVSVQQRFLEEIDAEKRAKNIVILGVPEDQDISVDGVVAENDEDKVKAVFRKIGKGDIHITSLQRLGNKDPTNQRTRPLKIVVPEAKDTYAIISNAKYLKDTVLDKVRIKRDTHPAVRKEMGRLFAAEKTEKEKAENQGRNVFFDKKRRVLTIDGAVADRFKPFF